MASKKKRLSVKQPKSPPPLSKSKNWIFTGVMILIPFLLIGMLELTLRLMRYGDDLSVFVPFEQDANYLKINEHFAQRYFYYYGDEFKPQPRKDIFLKDKPENLFRIFVMGASTTAGFPYENNVSFARVLHRMLADTYPDRKIEIINTAITAVNTYTLADIIDEVLDRKPDAILIYAGQNEYYGPFGPVSKVSLGSRSAVKWMLRLQRYKSFLLFRTLMRSAFSKWMNRLATDGGAGVPGKVADAGFLSKTLVPFEGVRYHQGLEQYESNLREILQKASRAGVPVVMSEVVSNVAGQKPFGEHDDPTYPHADKVFAQARRMEQAGNFDSARRAYEQARDLDPVRFRAPEAFNEILHKLGDEFSTPVVPMKSVFQSVSPNGLIGNNIMLEHVHPGVEGYFLMADAFYRTIQSNRIMPDAWEAQAIPNIADYRHHWGFTALDSVYAELVIMNLKSGWPFNTESFVSPEGKSVIDAFEPKNRVESYAFKAFRDEQYSLQVAHMELGDACKSEGRPGQAMDEYMALIYSIPAEDLFYRKAVELLLEMKDYETIVRILDDARKVHESAYIYKWLGQSHLMLNHFKDGIHALKQANALDTGDDQIVYNLARACYSILEMDQGNAALTSYTRIAPDGSRIAQLEKYRDAVKKRGAMADQLIAQAKAALQMQDAPKAVAALKQSADYHEKAEANTLIGMLLLQQGETERAIGHFMRADQMQLHATPELLSHWTLAYVKIRQCEPAKQTLQRLKTAFPDSEESARLESLIGQVCP